MKRAGFNIGDVVRILKDSEQPWLEGLNAIVVNNLYNIEISMVYVDGEPYAIPIPWRYLELGGSFFPKENPKVNKSEAGFSYLLGERLYNYNESVKMSQEEQEWMSIKNTGLEKEV